MQTPLTDAQIKDSAMYGLVVPAEFARQLETRLKESEEKCDQLKNLAMRLRVFAIHYGTHPKRNYQDKLDETLVDFDKIMNGN